MNPRKPVVTLVGAGPGDPELLTLKAVKALQAATVVLVDDLVHPDVLAHAPATARIVPHGAGRARPPSPRSFIYACTGTSKIAKPLLSTL